MEILESLAKIGFDWRVALANLINFLIIFYLLKRFVFAPMQGKLKERRTMIEKGVEDAQIAERERMMAGEQKETIISEANTEANTIVKDAREKEKEILIEASEKAVDETEKIKEKARISIEKEKGEMRDALRSETTDLVLSGVKKILKEEVDSKRNEEIIESVLKST